MKADRFSRENIDRLVTHKKAGNFKRFLKLFILAYLMDFFPIWLFVIWNLGFIIFRFDSTVYLIISIFLLGASIFDLYIVFVKFYKIKISRFKVVIGLKNSIKFGFISDIHIGPEYSATNMKRLHKLITKINSLDIDLLVIGGDFVFDKLDDKFINELKKIKIKKIIGVYGNHDADYLKEEVTKRMPEEFINKIENIGIKLLNNTSYDYEKDGETICFGGITDLFSKNFNIDQAFENAPLRCHKILVSHNPDIIDFIEKDDQIDLILSGHNHSGQVYLPFYGPVLKMPSKYRWLTKGIFEKVNHTNTKLLLSQGAGYSTTRLRIGTESEVCLVELV